MKRVGGVLAIVPVFALCAWAQKDVTVQRLKVAVSELQDLQDNLKRVRVMGVGGAFMGSMVKNAPYSAMETTESTQMLADGNRIHRENQTTVYRDSEGRVRRETGSEVTIWDPVANTSYFLDPTDKTARKMPLAMKFVHEENGRVTTFSAGSSVGPDFFDVAVPPLPPPPPPSTAVAGVPALGAMKMNMAYRVQALPGQTESLGKQTIEGLTVDGTRMKSTIEAGAIGNDRPIESVSESWYSPDLQTLVKSLHSDPRTGEETFRLTNVSRAEPPSTLFQVPADYTLADRK